MTDTSNNKKNLADTIESNDKSFSTINNCTCSINTSSRCHSYCSMSEINRFYQKHHRKIKIFGAIAIFFLLIILSIITIRYLVCVPKPRPNIDTQTKHEDNKLYTSVQTQTLQDDLYAEYGEFVVAIE